MPILTACSRSPFDTIGRFAQLLLMALCCLAGASQAWIATTVAGGPPGAGVNVEQYRIGPVAHAVADSSGNIYMSDSTNDRVLKLNLSTGTVTVAVGLGAKGFFGDGGQADSALLDYPTGLAIDASGNLYVADTGNRRVRRVDFATGNITTIAGNGTKETSGDGGLAVNAGIRRPTGLALDSAGNLYITDSERQRVRKVAAGSGVITTFAGTGIKGYAGDGGQATAARLYGPSALAVDTDGGLLIADSLNHRIRKVASNGVISTVVGTGTMGNTGIGGSAAALLLNKPAGLALNAQGNLLISDSGNSRIVRITGGQAELLAGIGQRGFSGDGALATAAKMRYPAGISVTPNGGVVIADTGNQHVRLVDSTTGNITSIAGSQITAIANAPFVPGQMMGPTSLTVDSAGNIFVADPAAHVVHKIEAGTSNVTTVAGTGTPGFSGDGGVATAAQLNNPAAVVTDGANLYISDTGNLRIRKVVLASGVISTIAGDGTAGYNGDGMVATSASLAYPGPLAIGPSGDLFVSDVANHRVRRISATTGVIQTMAGNGTPADAGLNILATSASIYRPSGLAVDAAGNLFIGSPSVSVRRVDVSTGIISIPLSFSGTSGASSIAVRPDGQIYAINSESARIFATVPGTSSAVALTFPPGRGFAGDGGDALNALFNYPTGIARDGDGNILVADTLNRAVRKLLSGPPDVPAGTISITSDPISVTFSAPKDNGFPILDYTFNCNDQTVTGTASPLTITGVPRNTTVTCSLVARNQKGSGQALVSTQFRPPVVPFAPSNVSATSKLGEIQIDFTPANDGGSLILRYEVNVGGQAVVLSGTTSPFLIRPPDIVGGVTYQLQIRAVNAVGAGFWSLPANSAAAIILPSPPNGPIGAQLNLLDTDTYRAQVSAVSAPSQNGGSAIIDYKASCVSTNPAQTLEQTGTSLTLLVSGLQYGVEYTCYMSSRNVAGYSALSVPSAKLNVLRTQTVTFAALPDRSLSNSPFTLSATGGGSGNPVVFTSFSTSVCSTSGLNGSTLTLNTVGLCQIVASQAGGNGYASASVSRSFNVTAALIAQTISFAALSDRVIGSSPFTVSATGGGSGLPVTFTSSTASVCTATGTNGATITLLTVGVCTIKASQQGNQSYFPAADVSQSFNVVTPIAQTITFAVIADRALNSGSFTVSATGGGSGNPVVFSSQTPGICSTSGPNGTTVGLLAVGTCSIRASQAAGGLYAAATDVTRSFAVSGPTISQTITFATLSDRLVGSAAFVVSATGGASGNPVTFTSTTPSVCSATGTNGSTITVLALGVCSVRASQLGNQTYFAAPDVTQSFNVVSPIAQTISFPSIADRNLSLGSFTLFATGGGSGNPVVFNSQSTSTCTTSGSNGATVTPITTGSCTIRATQAGGGLYAAAADVTRSFNINAQTLTQTITFESLPDKVLGSSAFTISATGGASGNPVTFMSMTTSVCSATGTNGTTITLLALGTCTIAAQQAGSVNYLSAEPVWQSFNVGTQANQVINFPKPADRALTAGEFMLQARGGGSGNVVTFVSLTPDKCNFTGPSATMLSLLAGGFCTIKASLAGGSGYLPAQDVTQSFAVMVTNQVSLAVTVQGLGVVNGQPGNLVCNPSCNTVSPVGNTITLTATASPGAVFTGWQGSSSCNHSLTTCSLLGLTNEMITAVFAIGSQSNSRYDLDGNGKADVVWRNEATGANWYWAMNGTTITAQGPITTLPVDWQFQSTAVDFDGDGKSDILLRNMTTGQPWIWFMNGNTIVGGGPLPTLSDLNWTIAGTGDLNGDGKGDVIWRNTSTGQNWWWALNGTTIINQGQITALPPEWVIQSTLGDFNGDGKTDLLWRNMTTGQPWVWMMDGTSIIANGPLPTLSDLNWTIAGTGDLNGDGKHDVVWRNTSTGANWYWALNGTTITAQGPITTLPVDWSFQSTSADFDGDGKADILLRNLTTGQPWIWFMNSNTITGGGPLPTLSDMNWQIKIKK